MKDQTTAARSSGEKPVGEAPEAPAESPRSENLDSLRDRVATAEQQRDDNLAMLQRSRADLENYQKRVQRDLAEERRYALAASAHELLPALDNLQRALEAARQQAE